MISLHPFPARMAPELAVARLDRLAQESRNSVVLDPMSGSGTVVRHASELGLRGYGFDLDPLAVLISRVSSRRIPDDAIETAAARILNEARALRAPPALSWIDGDPDGERFINYWYADKQRSDLRRIAYFLELSKEFGIAEDVAQALKVALSRIIVTKSRVASLAQDTSHSRPHRVATDSDYDVLAGFEASIRQLRRRLQKLKPKVDAFVEQGDARELSAMENSSVDLVLTSPPYLNALDYMRGHRMSLIWLGHRYKNLTATRSASIGAERAPDRSLPKALLHHIQWCMGSIGELPNRHQRMIERYIFDLHAMAAEIARVLRSGACATFVMGDSCLKGVFIKNSDGLAAAAELAGLHQVSRAVRDLPERHRYLPTPTSGALAKRMRKEIILTFRKP
jgi:hypothetical protein